MDSGHMVCLLGDIRHIVVVGGQKNIGSRVDQKSSHPVFHTGGGGKIPEDRSGCCGRNEGAEISACHQLSFGRKRVFPITPLAQRAQSSPTHPYHPHKVAASSLLALS